jgi:hypothetical protein
MKRLSAERPTGEWSSHGSRALTIDHWLQPSEVKSVFAALQWHVPKALLHAWDDMTAADFTMNECGCTYIEDVYDERNVRILIDSRIIESLLHCSHLFVRPENKIPLAVEQPLGALVLLPIEISVQLVTIE